MVNLQIFSLQIANIMDILMWLRLRRKIYLMEKLRFENINLSEEVQRGIQDMGFEAMSPIQAQAIPVILEGRDIIGQAQTGTGKTAAFGIPIIEKCNSEEKYVQALVLCPTRELSIQVAEEIARL